MKAPGFNAWILECDFLVSSLCFQIQLVPLQRGRRGGGRRGGDRPGHRRQREEAAKREEAAAHDRQALPPPTLAECLHN